jgi:hypothetical protein
LNLADREKENPADEQENPTDDGQIAASFAADEPAG